MRSRFSSAAFGLPDAQAWRRTAAECLWLLPAIGIVAFVGGLARFAPIDDAANVVRWAALIFVAPALGEELLFRWLLLSSPDRPGRLRIIASIALFVAWHPLQAFTFGPPWAAMFLDPWFLLATAILGVGLTRIYLATASIWPPVLVHWIVVFVWKVVFGGPITAN